VRHANEKSMYSLMSMTRRKYLPGTNGIIAYICRSTNSKEKSPITTTTGRYHRPRGHPEGQERTPGGSSQRYRNRSWRNGHRFVYFRFLPVTQGPEARDISRTTTNPQKDSPFECCSQYKKILVQNKLSFFITEDHFVQYMNITTINN